MYSEKHEKATTWLPISLDSILRLNMVVATSSVSVAPTSSTIKPFQFTQKYYHDIGIFPSQLQPNHFNRKNVFILSISMLTFTGMVLYFSYEAKSMEEMAITFYGFTSLLSSIIANLLIINQRDPIFRLFQSFEDFIGKRKSTRISLLFCIIYLPKLLGVFRLT